jgi:hypothetical protein
MRLLVTRNMNSIGVPMLACGPGPELILIFYGVIAAGVVCACCFLWGIVCLFTKMRTLGVCLITGSLMAVGGGLTWLGLLH